MQEMLSIDFRKTFPVFPLKDCVLLPNALLPLHIYEKRYREMVSRALDSYGLIAMALYQPDVTTEDYRHGQPGVRPYVGMGHIRHYERLDDGRYIILLQGICRAQVSEEIGGAAYRTMRLSPVDLGPHDETKLAPLRQKLAKLVDSPAFQRTKLLNELDLDWSDATPTSSLVDLIAMEACQDTEERYRILSEESVARRTGWLMGYLRALRASLDGENLFDA